MRKSPFKSLLICILLLITVCVFISCDKDGKSDAQINLESFKQEAIAELTILRKSYDDNQYSAANIDKLNFILEKAKSSINSALEKREIDNAVKLAKTDFLNVLTVAQEEQLEQDTLKKEFALYKLERQNELDSYREMLEDSKYSVANVNRLNEILKTAKSEIFFSQTHQDVMSIYNRAVKDLLAVPNLEQEATENLRSSKAAAVISLQNHRATKKDGDYTVAGLEELRCVLEDYLSKITDADTVKDVENFLHQGIVALDAVKLSPQSELDKFKNRSVETLREYRFLFNDGEYTEDGKRELDSIMNSAIERILAATDTETVAQIVELAKFDLQNVKKYSQLLIEYKARSDERVKEYRATKANNKYSEEGVYALDLILQNTLSAISDATTFEAVDAVVNKAVSAFDDVNVLASELAKIKQSKIEDLTVYRNSFLAEDYTADGIIQLDEILNNGVQGIMQAIELSEVNRVYQKTRLEMNSVLNIPQKLAQLKAVAVEELGNYRLTFNDNDYSDFGVQELNRLLSNGIVRINESTDINSVDEALISAKEDLDGVMIYPVELRFRKDEAITEIEQMRNSKNDAAYSDASIKTLDGIVSKYRDLLNLETQIQSVYNLKDAALSEISAVPTYSQELKAKIVFRINELRDYYAQKLTDKYTDDGAVLLEAALQDGIALIQSANTLEQLEEFCAEAILGIDDVKTYNAELNDAKDDAENDLRLYRATKLNGLYTEEGIISLNEILEDAIDIMRSGDTFADVSKLLEMGKARLDEVPTEAQLLESRKRFLKEDLEEYRLLKQDVNYSKEGIAKLNALLEAGKKEISDALTIEQAEDAFNRAIINLDAVPNLNQGIQIIRANACSALENHRNSKSNSDYTSDGVKMLDAELAQGLKNINKALDEKAVSDALNNAVAAIDAVKSIAQMLNESKNSALDELREYRRSKVDSEYSENGIKALDIALRDGEIAIDGAQSENEVNSALSSAKAALDAVPTESEENNFDIWELRESAVSELNSYRESLRDENYGPKGIQQLSDIMATLIPELNKADSPVEVDECVARIKDNLQSVPTFKFEYQNEIYSYRASFAESDFSTFGIEQLDAAVREYAGKVLESTDKDNASIVLSDAINAMDAVEQLDGESRANVKNLAVKEITDYRNSKPRDNYDESANDELDLILSQGISKIEFSVSDTEISEIISKIKNSMDEVQTIEQTEAVLWLAQYRESFDSEAYSEENLLLLDEIVDTFIKNIFSYASLQEALMDTVKSMDEILSINGECRQTVKQIFIDKLTQYKESLLSSFSYSENSVLTINSIYNQYLRKIQFSTYIDSDGLEAIVSDAKSAMDEVLTLREEANIEVEAYRATFNDLEYSDEGIAELDRILQEFIEAQIEDDALQSAIINAKEAMDLIEKKTDIEVA